MSPHTAERRALRFSALSALMFAGTGLGLGLASDSIAILFDSGYSLLSLLLVSLSLYALRQARKPADDQYPFGRLTIEPLAVLSKGVVIVLICLTSLLFALYSLTQGGREVALGLALVFGAVNLAGCVVTLWWLSRYQEHVDSSLLAAELRQWQMDAWLSAAVMLGFAVTWGLSLTPLADYARFADPLMVIVIVGYFLPTPINMIRGALKELMLGQPTDSVRQTIIEGVADFAIAEQHLRLAQVGRFLLVDIQLEQGQMGSAQALVTTLEQHCLARNLRPVTSISLQLV